VEGQGYGEGGASGGDNVREGLSKRGQGVSRLSLSYKVEGTEQQNESYMVVPKGRMGEKAERLAGEGRINGL